MSLKKQNNRPYKVIRLVFELDVRSTSHLMGPSYMTVLSPSCLRRSHGVSCLSVILAREMNGSHNENFRLGAVHLRAVRDDC